MARVLFTPGVLAKKPPKSGRIELRDDLTPLRLRISDTGDRVYTVRTRIRGQENPVRITFPEPAHISNLEKARAWAVQTVGQCRQGIDPREQDKPATGLPNGRTNDTTAEAFETVARRYIDQHVSNLKSARTVERYIERFLLPAWGNREIGSIGRRDVADLLDEVAAVTPTQRNRVHATVSHLFNWYQARTDDFHSPVVRGLAKTEERTRERTLADAEVATIWPAAETGGPYGAMVRLALFTGMRRGELVKLRRSWIDGDGVLRIPAAQYKTGREFILPLAPEALAVINEQPCIDEGDLVFPSQVKPSVPLGDWSLLRERFDKHLSAQGARFKERWTLHDCRRTVRTWLPALGVTQEIGERYLGHAVGRIERTYNRYDHVPQLREAAEHVAAHISKLTGGNVVTMAGAAE